MLITGQDIGYADNYYRGMLSTATFNPSLYFGGAYATDDILDGDVNVPAFIGSPYTPSLWDKDWMCRTTVIWTSYRPG